jgi:hypothetical protein
MFAEQTGQKVHSKEHTYATQSAGRASPQPSQLIFISGAPSAGNTLQIPESRRGKLVGPRDAARGLHHEPTERAEQSLEVAADGKSLTSLTICISYRDGHRACSG